MKIKKKIASVIILLALSLPVIGMQEQENQTANLTFEYTSNIYDDTKVDKMYSPIWGMVLLKSGILKNIRLFGNYSSVPNNSFPMHSAFDKNLTNNCPQDPIAAFVQFLFPSVDGSLLTHNERKKDPWGEVARTIERTKGFEALNKILLCIITKPEDMESQLTEIFQSVQWTEKITQTNKLNIIKQSVDNLIQAIQYNNKDRLYPQDIVIHTILAFAWKMANNVKDLYKLTDLLQNLSENKVFSKKDYESNIKKIIQKFMNQDGVAIQDQILYTQGYVSYKRPIPELIQYKSTRFFDIEKKLMTESYPDCGEVSLLNLFYILLGGKEGVVTEERLKNFFNNIQCQNTELIDFFTKYPSIYQAVTDSAHEDWSKVVSNLNSKKLPDNLVFYNSDMTHNLPGRAGIINMFSVIGKLFPNNKILNKEWDQKEFEKLAKDVVSRENENAEYPKLFKQATDKLNSLCQALSAKNFKISWLEKASNENEITKNTNTEIIFSVNGEPLFVWKMTSRHFEIIPLDKQDNDWRKFVSFKNNNFEQSDLMQIWFFQNLDINGKYRDQIQPYHLWGLNLKDTVTASKVINFILEKDDPMLENIIPLLISKSIPTDDEHAKKILFPVWQQHKQKLQQLLGQNNLYEENWMSDGNVYENACEYGYTDSIMNENNPKKSFDAAVTNGYYNIASFYKAQKDCNVVQESGWATGSYPIHHASEWGHTEIVELLIEDYDKKDSLQRTPLFNAENQWVADILVKKAEENHRKLEYIDYQDENGYTALMDAAQFYRLEVVQYLVDNHADPNIYDKDKKSAGHYAIKHLDDFPEKCLAILKYLADHELKYDPSIMQLAEENFNNNEDLLQKVQEIMEKLKNKK